MSQSEVEKRHLRRFRRELGDRRPAMRLQERDLEIIKLVYDHRFLSTPMLHQLVEGSARGVALRLQKLFHNRYLDRLKLDDTSPIIYALGNRGADELTLHYGIDRQKVDWTSKNREVGEHYVRHGLMISRFRFALTLALRERKDVELGFWEPEGTVKDKVSYYDNETKKTRDTPLVPDAFFSLEQQTPEGARLMPFFLEADRSTMTNERFGNKLRGYYELWQQRMRGGKSYGVAGHTIKAFRVLALTISEMRRDNLREVAKTVSKSALFWFACERVYKDDPANVLGQIWKTPADDEARRLL